MHTPTHTPTPHSPAALRAVSRSLYAEPAVTPRAPHSPDPSLTLAQVLFAMCQPVRPSKVIHTYGSIACAPRVGRNLSAQA